MGHRQNNPPHTVLVLGSINIDHLCRLHRHPEAGETLTASSFTLSAGGKGANQAAAIGKLSRRQPKGSSSKTQASSAVAYDNEQGTVRVCMSGAVGDDEHGRWLLQQLRSYGVDTSAVRVRSSSSSNPHSDSPDGNQKAAKTGMAIVMVEESSGENRIIVIPEANATVSVDEFATVEALCAAIAPHESHQPQSPHQTSQSTTQAMGLQKVVGTASVTTDFLPSQPAVLKPALLVMQMEIPLATVAAALVSAREARVPVLLNAAPAMQLPTAKAWAGVTHLVVNETEAMELTAGVSPVATTSEEPALNNSEEAYKRAAGILAQRGPRTVIITLGSRGAFYHDRVTGRHGVVRGEKATRVVDTTAAGDAFVGAFALYLVGAIDRGEAGAGFEDDEAKKEEQHFETVKVTGDNGAVRGQSSKRLDLEAAIRCAHMAAKLTVERHGAQASIPWMNELPSSFF